MNTKNTLSRTATTPKNHPTAVATGWFLLASEVDPSLTI